MPRTIRRPLGALRRSFNIVTLLVVLLPFTSLAQSADEAKLRELVEGFFAAYEHRDVSMFLPLWSDRSPNRAAAKQSFERGTGANKIELKSLVFRKLTVQDEKASVRVVLEMKVMDASTGAVVNGPGKQNRTLDCVKEGEGWKVWRYVASEEDLAVAVLSAKTSEERKALLSGEKELLTPDLALSFLAHGSRAFNQSDYSRASDAYERAADLATDLGDKTKLATALGGLGAVYAARGDYRGSLVYYEKAEPLAEEVGDKTLMTKLLNNIGVAYRQQGNNPRALEYYRRALKIRQEMGDKAGTLPMLTNIGVVHRVEGNLTDALEYLQNSLKLAGELGEKKTMATDLNVIGTIYESLGNQAQALEYFQRSLKISEELGDKAGAANVLRAIGVLHEVQGNYSQALEYYRSCQKIGEEIGNKELIGLALGSLGNIHNALGNSSAALECYEKSLKAAEELGSTQYMPANLFNIGHLHFSQGNTELALEYYQKSLKISEQIAQKEKIAESLVGIGEVYLVKGEYRQAVDIAARGIAVAEQGGALVPLSELHTIAGKGYRGLNQPDQARRAFADAIAVIEKLRSNVAGGTQQEQRFFEGRIAAYYQMVELLIGQQSFADAFAYAERVKGRALLDSLQSGRVNITRAMTAKEQDEERKVNGEVNSLNIQITTEKVRERPDAARVAELDARLTKARVDQERFQINLYAAHPELRVQRGQMQPISLEQTGRLIPDTNTALLEYVVAEEKTQLFVLSRASDAKGQQTPTLKVYTLNMREKELAERVEKFRGRLANQDFLFHEPARELYALLLGPARAELQNKTNLIIVPDGILWELPFQALESAPNRFLIENNAISYAPSLTVLLEMTRPRPAAANNSPKLLALGNPAIGKQATNRIQSVHMDERLDPLPDAERQVKEIGKLYGPERSRIYIGPEAQEVKVKTEAGGYGILHLAAHGILNDKNPMYSQVVLSQPEGDTAEDGMLEAWEVMKLDLKADLVVLSACETARGKVGNGEGMVGLSWAFFVAGVPTTVASQWSVEAASTTELMVEFHRNLERHKSRAESLRQAMLKLLKSKEYGRPFYWAGFVVVGNGR